MNDASPNNGNPKAVVGESHIPLFSRSVSFPTFSTAIMAGTSSSLAPPPPRELVTTKTTKRPTSVYLEKEKRNEASTRISGFPFALMDRWSCNWVRFCAVLFFVWVMGSVYMLSETVMTRIHPPVAIANNSPVLRGIGSQVLSASIPLPIPKEKISVVLMNYGRPRMIRESTMMRTLLSHPNVDEILLLHSNPRTAFEFVHEKVVNIDAVQENDEMGLSLRFFFCQMASNPWVLHLDDDMEFTTEALNQLLVEYSRDPKRIVGRYGRNLNPGNFFNGYSSKSTSKSTEVVLTKLMLVEREICSAFFEHAFLVWDDLVLPSTDGPLWNGEDIFLSLVANHVYGPPKDGRQFNNYAMDWLDVWSADESLKDYSNGKMDISGGMPDGILSIRPWDWRWIGTFLRRNRHYSYRGKLWQEAKRRLQSLEQ